MKTTKKILALVMAIAFVFSLCMFSANAYDNLGYVNVEIRMEGDYAWDIDLDATTIASYIGNDIAPMAPYTDNPYHIYYVPTVADPLDDPYTTALTAADALLAAYLETYNSYDEDQVHYTWYENEGDWGIYFDCYEGLEPDGAYYFVDSWTENGHTYYEYYWEGLAWNLYINKSGYNLQPTDLASLYSSEYELGTSYAEFNNAQPTKIVLDYNYAYIGDIILEDRTIPGAN